MDSSQSGDSDTDTHLSVVERRRFEPTTSDDLAQLVVETVAAAGHSTTERPSGPPLYESVDIDALYQVLFETSQDLENQLEHEQLSFEYQGFTVVISGEGCITVKTNT